MKTDLVLLHAPSVYDFRKKSIMFGPVSDLVPSTPIFEMYPIGFLTMANYLSRRGINVRIVNLAYRMLADNNFDAEKFIKALDTAAFGIDLHWLPHCQGSIEIARIVKKYHSAAPVIFGGFSSSYFYRELIEFEQVDYIIKGDSAEEPLYRLVGAIKSGNRDSLKDIPNLVWKEDNKIYDNPITNISRDLSEIDFDYRFMFKEVLKYRDIKSVVPFTGWFRYPITTIPVVRGCNNDCCGCGGSRSAFKRFGGRIKPSFRDPEKLVDEIKMIQKHIRTPIFLLGDLNSNGSEYVRDFFKYAKGLDREIQIFFEFFEPPDNSFFDMAADTFSNVCYEISPDSHSEDIRKKVGKSFSNENLKTCIKYALDSGALRFDLYFMTGLPGQTRESINETVDYCRDIFEYIEWDKRFMPFISPMAPFLDPGSRAFEDPEKFGYRLTRRTLKDHIEAITMPSWKYILNYESMSITTDDLVDATYDAAMGLNRLKGRSGGISGELMAANQERIIRARKVMDEIDDIIKIKDRPLREKKLERLKEKANKYSLSTVCEKKELEFPLFSRSFNWVEIIKSTLGRSPRT
ncbi:MAG: TIGR04190 family B12-binding domain/radical SAM domain protein [Actinomycetia bacterium]|nr:TIGR04190 family B12-binding domain/radical SAM domain protein [Actinomycetes bacterium]